MIGRLSGTLVARGDGQVVIDVGGVGYQVFVSDRTLAALPAVGASAALWTDLLVREDLLQLFGFTSLAEKEWHRTLMAVQGIGAKASMAILGALGPDGLASAIALGDWGAVKAAPGVGPKIAQRVVNELKDKAPVLMALDGGPGPAGTGTGAPQAPPTDPAAAVPAGGPASGGAADPVARADALSALANLGYGPAEAARAVAEASREAPEAGAPELIRAALRRLAPGG